MLFTIKNQEHLKSIYIIMIYKMMDPIAKVFRMGKCTLGNTGNEAP